MTEHVLDFRVTVPEWHGVDNEQWEKFLEEAILGWAQQQDTDHALHELSPHYVRAVRIPAEKRGVAMANLYEEIRREKLALQEQVQALKERLEALESTNS